MLLTRQHSTSQQPTFQQSRIIEQEEQEERLATLERVVRKFYFFHLFMIAAVYTYLLIAQRKRFKLSFTSVLLGVYCYMCVWNWVVNFALVICHRDTLAIIFNRVCIRFIIMLFFPIGTAASLEDRFLGIDVVMVLMLYLITISLLFIVYEIYGCTLGEQKNPPYIFESNDLKKQTERVWQIRREYNRQIIEYEKERELTNCRGNNSNEYRPLDVET